MYIKKLLINGFIGKFEYDVVAVVDNEAKINTVHDLRGAKYCHGYGFGFGLKSHWTAVISNVSLFYN